MSERFEVLEDSYLSDVFTGQPELVARKGDIVFHYYGPTYGCISPEGIACSVDGFTPFFEVPIKHLRRFERLEERTE